MAEITGYDPEALLYVTVVPLVSLKIVAALSARTLLAAKAAATATKADKR
jgi:hypothetical protein